MNITTSGRVGAGLVILAMVLTLGAGSQPAVAQDSATDQGLVPLIPPNSLMFIERRGHTRIKPAFDASNLGKMAHDEAIDQFVNASRVAIGKKIMQGIYNIKDPQELIDYHAQLHELLKPFWYNQGIMFAVPSPKGLEESPGLGFICEVDMKNFKTCKAAVEFFRKAKAADPGQPGVRQTFTYTCNGIIWQGVLKRHGEFALPDFSKEAPATTLPTTQPDKPATLADELKNGSVFMYTWRHRLLYVSFSMHATEAISKAMSGPDGTISPNIQAVLNKTRMKNWAFRWYGDVDGFLRLARKKESDSKELFQTLDMLGVDKVKGLGGTCGYIDNVYARRTYVNAPGTGHGVLKLFKAGGSYKKALSMAPLDSTFLLAGQLDTAQTDKFARLVCTAIAIKRSVGPDEKIELTPDQQKQVDRNYPPIRKLIAASDGNLAFFAGDLQAVVMGSAPAGFVLGIKDRPKAVEAVNELLKLAGIEEPEAPATQPATGPATQPTSQPTTKPVVPTYRGILIRNIGGPVQLAILKDRVVFTFSDNATKAAIDTALDKVGGFEEGSKGDKMLRKCPSGPVVFSMDLAALAKLAWPMLVKTAEGAEEGTNDFPLAALPSTQKMVRMLGPETAVMIPDSDGLLLDSRGKIPFSTKMVLGYPMVGYGVFFLMMMAR